MNQNQIAELFDTSIPNISIHTKNIFEEGELSQESVIKNYLTTASDGKENLLNLCRFSFYPIIGYCILQSL